MDEGADPFAPLTDIETPSSTSKASATDAEVWEPQLPAPCDPPEVAPKWHGREAIRRSVYRGLDGAPLFAVYRYPTEDGGKEDIPYTFGRRVWADRNGNLRDKTGWHFRRPQSPIPLYGLERLATRPGAAVLTD